jgi:replicative DNA helicase
VLEQALSQASNGGQFDDRVPPQDLEAERAVLGSMVLDNHSIPDVLLVMDADDFYSPRHAQIWQAITGLWQDSKSVDLITLRDRLQQKGALDTVGGVGALVGIAESVPSAVNAAQYAGIVRDMAVRRRVILQSVAAMREAHEGKALARDILSKAQTALLGISTDIKGRQAVEVADVLADVMAGLDSAKVSHGIDGIPSGLSALDRVTFGWKKGEVIIVAGRPSMGKSALAVQLALAAGAAKKRTAVFSMEMDTESIVQRLIAAEANVPMGAMRRGYLKDEEWGEVNTAIARISTMPIVIDDTPAMTPVELRARMMRLNARTPLDLVLVDYLQLMHHPISARDGRQQEISAISREIKALARDLEVPVIALSQLNRAPETRGDNRPRMSDLRESGALEQDADKVILLYRPGYYSGEHEDRRAEIIVAKHRNGPTATLEALFLAKEMRFGHAVLKSDLRKEERNARQKGTHLS